MISNKGNSTIALVLLSLGLSSVMGFVLSLQESSMVFVQQLDTQKSTYYLAESLRSSATSIAQKYFKEEKNPTTTGLQSILSSSLTPIVPEGYTLSSINSTIVDLNNQQPIPNGPFKGMLAPQTLIKLGLEVNRGDGEHKSAANLDTTVTLAQISPFQFTYFFDLDYTDFNPGPLTEVRGWVHANGMLCLGGTAGLTLDRVTASGKIKTHMDPECRFTMAGDQVFIKTKDPAPNDKALLKPNADSGCTNCDGTGLNWWSYAKERFDGNLLDVAHGVVPLRLPIPQNLWVQWGHDQNRNIESLKSNANNLRFVVDPVWTGEPQEAKVQKISYQADIRIVGGIWYLKNPANANDYPGIPIWSDNPNVTIGGQGRGQRQIRLARGWTRTPERFSYYEFDQANQTLTGDDFGVISYGNLIRYVDGSGRVRWRPGFYLEGANANNICVPDAMGTPNSITSANRGLLEAKSIDVAGSSQVTCALAGSNPTKATAYLNAARSGFKDGHIQELLDANAWTRNINSRMLPMNFDLEQFQEALDDTRDGELGSYFGVGRFMNRPFNGIVYIETQFGGYNTQLTTVGRPTGVMPQELVNSPYHILPTGDGQHGALPHNLCSQDTPNLGMDRSGGFTRFRTFPCASGTPRSFVNSVRIVNGGALLPTKFPKGLTIGSNIQVYIQGDLNSNSVPNSTVAGSWMPLLIAADSVTFLSNGWSDTNSRWHRQTFELTRIAQPTVYNSAILTGWTRYSGTMQAHTVHAMMEDWTSATFNFSGSTVVGFYPVFRRVGRMWHPLATYRAGVRNLSFDTNYSKMSNQPPGTPIYNVSSVSTFRRK